MTTRELLSNSFCAEQVRAAERELAAFLNAVTTLYGRDYAEVSAGEWLDGVESIGAPSQLQPGTWRAITIESSARLARRLNADHVRASTANATHTKVSSTPSSNTATLKVVI